MDLPAVILTGLLSGGSAGALIVWFWKKLVEQRFKLDLSEFEIRLRDELNRDATREIEQMKHELNRISIEHQHRFSVLHVRTADAIEKAYELLSDAHGAIANAVMMITVRRRDAPWPIELIEDATAASAKFQSFVNSRRILFDAELCDTLVELFKRFNQVFTGMTSMEQMHAKEDREEITDDLLTMVRGNLEGAILDGRLLLERRFRAMLAGVPTVDG